MTAFWFDPLLAFANAHADEIEATVKRLRGTVAFFSDSNEKAWGLSLPEEWSVETLRKERAAFVRLLDQLIEHGVTDQTRARIFGAIESARPRMPSVRGIVVPLIKPSRLKLIAQIVPTTVTQWFGLALNELVAQGYGGKIKRCALRSCRAYFVDVSTRKPRVYCYDPADHGAQDRTAAIRAGTTTEKWRNRE